MNEQGSEFEPSQFDRPDVAERQYIDWYALNTNIRLGMIDEYVIDGRNIRREVVDLIELVPGGAVLDIGCANAELLRMLRQRRNYDGTAVGLDIDLTSLELAKSNERRKSLKAINYIKGDMSKLPFADRSFSSIVNTFSIHHAQDLLLALSEIDRVLDYDAQFIATANSQQQKGTTASFLSVIAGAKKINPPQKFADVFSAETAPEVLGQFFDIVEIRSHISEMRFYAKDSNVYRVILNTYASEYDPPLDYTMEERPHVVGAFQRAYDKEIARQGYVSDKVSRDIIICRKKPA